MSPELRGLIINDIITATMPDGSQITSDVKADTILDALGIEDCPSELRRLVALGVVGVLARKRRHARQSRSLRHQSTQ